jgi:hypothetical protein
MPIYTYTTLGDPLATNGPFPQGINDAGQIVGYFSFPIANRSSLAFHGFLLSGGTYTAIDDPRRVPRAPMHKELTGLARSSVLILMGATTATAFSIVAAPTPPWTIPPPPSAPTRSASTRRARSSGRTTDTDSF